MAYGTKTVNVMDIPLSISSVVAPYLGDNGYKFEGSNSIRVLSISDGSLSTYDEGSATAPFGSASLVVPAEQVLTLAYNKSMLLRIQRTQMQDIPVSDFSKQVSMQQARDVFIPAHDAYSISKILASRPVGNKVTMVLGTDDIKIKFSQTVDKSRTGGGEVGKMVAWVGYEFATQLTAAINFTGSDKGYAEGKKGYLGMFKGVTIVEAPDAYLGTDVYVIVTDKRAVVNVTPKMDPSNGGVEVLDKVPGFSGIEIQLRDRSDTFVLSKKVNSVASLEEV